MVGADFEETGLCKHNRGEKREGLSQRQYPALRSAEKIHNAVEVIAGGLETTMLAFGREKEYRKGWDTLRGHRRF